MALTAHQLMMRFGERNLFQIERLSIAAGDAIGWQSGASRQRVVDRLDRYIGLS